MCCERGDSADIYTHTYTKPSTSVALILSDTPSVQSNEEAGSPGAIASLIGYQGGKHCVLWRRSPSVRDQIWTLTSSVKRRFLWRLSGEKQRPRERAYRKVSAIIIEACGFTDLVFLFNRHLRTLETHTRPKNIQTKTQTPMQQNITIKSFEVSCQSPKNMHTIVSKYV